MKKVYSTTVLIQAELVRVLLRKYRIPSMLEGADVGIRGPATPIGVTVADQHAPRAMELIKERFLRKSRRKASKKRPKARKSPRSRPRKR